MAAGMKEVFVANHSIVSPLGFTSEENFNNIVNGNSGIQSVQYSFSDNPFFISALDEALVDEHFKSHASPLDYTKLEKMSIMAISHVLNQSNVNASAKDTLLIYATTKGNIDLLDKASSLKKFATERMTLNGFAKHIAAHFSFVNEPIVISNACISGLLALIVAKRFIEAELYKNVVVAAGDIISEFVISGFKAFNALSQSACRPYDRTRDGISLGEAAVAMIVTENKSIANNPLRIVNGSSSNDANHISGPSRDGNGLLQSIHHTLKENDSNNVDFICAHGTATVFNDEMEAMAFSRAGLEEVPMNSLKGYFGHTLGAAGLLETIISIESLNNDLLIASKGFENEGVSKKINVIEHTETKKNMKSFLKTSSGFGGCNASVLISK